MQQLRTFSAAAGEGLTVTVRFLDGSARSFSGVNYVDDVRWRVAEDLGVHMCQVELLDGLHVLRVNLRLTQLHLGPELLATMRQDPEPLPRRLLDLLQFNPMRQMRHITRVREAVRLPDGVRLHTWLAARLLVVYGEVAEVAAALQPFCTPASCPCMRAGKRFTYVWAEGDDSSTRRELSAPDYTSALIQLAHRILGGADFLPKEGQPLADGWMDAAQMLLRRFFRVYAHAYLHHLDELGESGEEKHLNGHFQHFLFFVREFDLMGNKDLAPLQPVVKHFEELRPDQLTFHT